MADCNGRIQFASSIALCVLLVENIDEKRFNGKSTEKHKHPIARNTVMFTHGVNIIEMK